MNANLREQQTIARRLLAHPIDPIPDALRLATLVLARPSHSEFLAFLWRPSTMILLAAMAALIGALTWNDFGGPLSLP